jgi:hypothetical protein
MWHIALLVIALTVGTASPQPSGTTTPTNPPHRCCRP